TDITDLIAAEEKLRIKEVEKLRREHQLEMAHVSRINLMGEMATGIAHELNQPLTAVNNYINGCIRRLIKEQNSDKSMVVTKLKKAANEASCAADIIQHLRDFLTKGKLQVSCLDVNILVNDSVELLSAEIKEKAIQINWQLVHDATMIIVDTIQLKQVIVNLIKNAIDAVEGFAENRRCITLTTALSLDKKTVFLLVTDTGSGISSEAKFKIFDQFFTTKKEGMGMGLAISRSIVEIHRGQLILEDTSAQGTTFKISLPIASTQ
ncbi:MAG: GHKL domain-containing protein, partial [Gammaproteobacteria bacterium]|nr:GHKL domain-containing protein [Gammaproteobacteria bacterium]